jgi:chloramphenicol-sensitive protein RarD
MDKTFGKGIIFASLSFLLWGVFPLYWKFLITVDSLHILAFRILLSLVLVGAILLANKNTTWLAVFREPKKAAILIPTALFLCCNWGLYIWAVNRAHTLEASLGYYINPLVSIILGLVFFRERLRPLQWAAAAIALAGVLILTLASGSLPWISLGLALTFGFYGLFKKKLALSALESLGAETLASAPIGIFLLLFHFGGTSSSGRQGLSYLSALPPQTWVLLALCGFVTALPLYFFAYGTKLLPLSTLGFIQFINPTLQFALGLFVFKENFPTHHFVAFIFIWTAVIVYIVSLKKRVRGQGAGFRKND